jgi:hypothetical protein
MVQNAITHQREKETEQATELRVASHGRHLVTRPQPTVREAVKCSFMETALCSVTSPQHRTLEVLHTEGQSAVSITDGETKAQSS